MRMRIKRIFDVLLSLTLMIILFPIFIILYVLIKIKLGSPVLFSQQRPGKNGKVFRMYKFRSMNEVKDEEGQLLPDGERLTKFGQSIRILSVDELPELWNILKGDMSFVGPRPLLVRYLDRYSTEQMRRHEVKPGLTGWAQVNGRNAISWEEKFKLDVWYVDNWTLYLDIRIMFMTIAKVLKHEGISSGASATMEEFQGSGEKIS